MGSIVGVLILVPKRLLGDSIFPNLYGLVESFLIFLKECIQYALNDWETGGAANLRTVAIKSCLIARNVFGLFFNDFLAMMLGRRNSRRRRRRSSDDVASSLAERRKPIRWIWSSPRGFREMRDAWASCLAVIYRADIMFEISRGFLCASLGDLKMGCSRRKCLFGGFLWIINIQKCLNRRFLTSL
jgi:hypothetical protein